jgi:hypothetical protein
MAYNLYKVRYKKITNYNIMNFKGLLIALGFVFMLSSVSVAQSAVYFDSSNGAIGFAYGNYNVNMNAYNNAKYFGAVYPVQILSVSGKGFGAIITGRNIYGGYVIGTAAGQASMEQAQYYAYYAAINSGAIPSSTRVFTSWFDR